MIPDKDMMHGKDFADFPWTDPEGWIVTEKFDGFFARWTGDRLITREGHDYKAPDWFTERLPRLALDCELFAGYGNRGFLSSSHRWRDKGRWRSVELIVFDTPAVRGGYAVRHRAINAPGLRVAKHWTCSGMASMIASLAVIQRKGGEGLMIRHPEAPYEIGRVQTLLKVKPHMFP